MNYRHKYHAGSFADIVKHTVLLALIDYLQKKPAPYTFIDTHAGEGIYDLQQESSQKTGEAQAGILRLLNYPGEHPADVARYIDLVKSCDYYPGSPMIAAQTMREQDVLILNEKHPQTYQLLKQNIKRAAVHQRDAYEFLPAILPPKTNRGLVFIDPAFEDELEMQHLAQCLAKCYERWPQGMYLIWLPVVGRTYYSTSDLQHDGFKNYLSIEFNVDVPSESAQGLIGNSLLLINPPWQIENALNPLLAHLWQVLHNHPQSQWRIISY